MTPAQERVGAAVATSTSAVLGARAVHFALNVVSGLALIRYLGPASYGDYVFVLSFAAIFGLLSDFGIAKVAVRDLSRRDGDEAAAVLGTAIASRVALALTALVLAQIALAVVGGRADIRVAVAVASLAYAIEGAMTVTAVFQVRLVMQYEAAVTLVVQALDTALVLALIALGAGLVALVAAPIAAGTCGVAIATALARRRFSLRARFDARRVRSLLVESLPIGITTVIVVLYVKSDAVLLQLLASSREVGLFGAAYKPIEYAFLALILPTTVLLPLLSRWYGVDVARYRAVFWRGIDLLLALSLPITAMTLVVSDDLVALYAPGFAAAATALRLLALALPSMIVAGWLGFALLAAGRQRVTLAYDAAALVVNVAVNLALIPMIGQDGAAVAALATTAFVVLSAALAVRTWANVGPMRSHAPQLVLVSAALALAVAVGRGAGVPWWAAVCAAACAYPILVIASGAVSLPELRSALPARKGAPAA